MALSDKSPQAVWNHPQWWIDRVRKDHPAQWQAILQANNAQAPLILRINPRKTTQADYLHALALAGINADPVGEHGVILMSARSVPSLPGFAQGHFSVQDAATQLAAPLLLDGLTAGMRDGELTIVAARPGMGKTALAANICFNSAKRGKPTQFNSLEMNAAQLAVRQISAAMHEPKVPYSRILRGKFTEAEFNAIAETARIIAAIPMDIIDQEIGRAHV